MTDVSQITAYCPALTLTKVYLPHCLNSTTTKMKKAQIQVFVVPLNEELNLMLLYLLHMIIWAKRTEWAASQVLQDHMAMVCGGVWAVVSFSVLLFGVKGLGGGAGGGIIYTPKHILSFKTYTHSPIHTSTKAHYHCHYSSTHDPDIFNPLYMGAKPHCGITTVRKNYFRWW